LTSYCLGYRRAGQDHVERFGSATARALRLMALPVPVELCRVWLEVANVEARNTNILRAIEREEMSA
jgi:hypothetical protein